jgi:type IV pilus assembly protein PilX
LDLESELDMKHLRRHRAPASRQSGVMLVIALIVLVAMTMAGLAMMRSVDTATIVAGNVAYKQSTVSAADQGLQTGYWWLSSNASGATLHSDNTGAGYLSSVPLTEPDWMNDAAWSNAFSLNGGAPDAYNNRIQYLIHRMCPVPNCAPEANCLGNDNKCGSTPDLTAVTGDGLDHTKAQFWKLPPQVHYRITARAIGPRNSVTVVQSMVRIQ